MQFTRLGRPWSLALSLTSLAIAVSWLASSLWNPEAMHGNHLQRPSSTNVTTLARLSDGIVFMTNHGSGFNPSAQPPPAPDDPRPH
jgi:hypothetical protein